MGIGVGLLMLRDRLDAEGVTPLASGHKDNYIDARTYALDLNRIGDPRDSSDTLEATCVCLVDYIIEGKRSDRLDLPVTMIDRYNGVKAYLDRFYPANDERRTEAFSHLRDTLVSHYRKAGEALRREHPFIRIKPFIEKLSNPSPYAEDGTLHVNIPKETANRSLQWNGLIIDHLNSSENAEEDLAKLFSLDSHPVTEALKLGDGTWLHVTGFIMCEAGQFGGRLRTQLHDAAGIPQEFLAHPENEYYYQEDWYITTHVMGKTTAELAKSIGATNEEETTHLDADSVIDSYEVLVELMDLNPGVFESVISESWIWDDNLSQVFPGHSIGTLAKVAGDAKPLRVVTDQEDIMAQLAKSGSRTRRQAIESGEFLPTVYDRRITREQMLAHIAERNRKK
jgi:hypothetical protein